MVRLGVAEFLRFKGARRALCSEKERLSGAHDHPQLESACVVSVHQPWRRRSTLKREQTSVGAVLAVGELVAASLSQPGSVFDPKYYMATFLTEATISYPPTRLLSGRDAIGRESWSGLLNTARFAATRRLS